MEKSLSGKTALVTGSTSGLGKDIAEALAQAGCRVALNGFGDRAEIEALLARLKSAHGVEVSYHGANLMRPSEIAEMMTQVADRFGAIDILVNNAGIQFVSPLEDFPAEKWDAVLAVNLSAAFHTTKAVLPAMKARKWGRIINIASAHGLVASPYKSAYVAAKHGLVGLTKVTALETARNGITCNALCPGYLRTPLVDSQIEAQAKSTGVAPEKVIGDVILAKHPTKEFVLGSQIAAYVLLLCSPAGASTTGAALSIDGGWTSS
jgi:3-hydroxybutyrate dehydrogenase